MLGAHAFVTLVFGVMAMSFITTTGFLAWEFWDQRRWVDLMALDSHLFVFFPTFGVIALLAFYLPSVVFVDHYWRNVKFGKARFLVGLVAAVLLSHFFSNMILSGENQNRSVWEVKPEVLASDRGQPAGCADDGVGRRCARVPVLMALASLRKLSQQRIGVKQFERKCTPDPFIEEPDQKPPKRYCVATTPFPRALDQSTVERVRAPAPYSSNAKVTLVDDQACCAAQDLLVKKINALWKDEDSRSHTGKVHAMFLPLKVFFLLVLLMISVMLTIRFKSIEAHYGRLLNRISYGLVIGTIAALFFPLMSQAFLQSLSVTFGASGAGEFSRMVPVLSLVFGAWTLLMVLFFFRRNGDKVEQLAKVVGGIASGGFALLNYESIVSWLVRIMGSGASWVFFAILVVMALLLASVLAHILVNTETPEVGKESVSGPDPDAAA